MGKCTYRQSTKSSRTRPAALSKLDFSNFIGRTLCKMEHHRNDSNDRTAEQESAVGDDTELERKRKRNEEEREI